VPRFLTVGQVSRRLSVPAWKVRSVVDSLGIQIPRAGQYRLLSPDVVERVNQRISLSNTPGSNREKRKR
jgi:hypothetical protein